MNLIFKVFPKEKDSLIQIAQKINGAPCKMFFDFSNEMIYAIDIESVVVDNVIDFIAEYYNIEYTKLDNAFNEKSQKHEVASVYKPLMERLINTINSVDSKDEEIELDIKNFLRSCNEEIFMRYSENAFLDIEEGQLVECNLGQNLRGEISGSRVPCVVYEIKSKMVRVIPIIRRTNILDGYLKVELNDFTSDTTRIEDGYFAICKSLFIRRERIKSVRGRITEEKLKFLKSEISKYYTFGEIISISNEKDALYEIVADKLHNPDIKSFLESIGMNSCDEMINAFECAFKLSKITYDNILEEMRKKPKYKDNKELRSFIKHKFNIWLMNYPNLKKEFTKISLTSLIKLYVETNKE